MDSIELGGIDLRSTSLLLALLLIMPASGIFLITNTSATQPLAGSEAYMIGPFDDITSMKEDELYSSRYFAVMGDLTQYSLVNSPDWLSVNTNSPLTLNTTGLEGRWTFDMRNADDTSGNRHHGTVTGATADTGVFGVGSSMSFDGDDYITIPHHDNFNITDEITLEAWIYPTFTDSLEHMIISKGGHWGDDDPQDYELTIDRDRPLFQMKIPGSNDWYGAAPMEPITKNTWHHIAGVYDGTIFKIFIDGINQTSIYNGWSGDYKGHFYAGGLPTSSDNISIGRRQPASWGSLFYEGNIDEVRIFDRALENEEILEHATKPGINTILLTGTPDNSDVGNHQLTLNITDGSGLYDERDFTITVENVDPIISTVDITETYQDQVYSVDYNADEEGQGTTSWDLHTNADFLTMDANTGLLSGTPTNDDVELYDVTVVFRDGSGGSDSHDFFLTVIDVNDPPVILTESIPNATEDQTYAFALEGDDIDNEILNWTFETDADWIFGFNYGSITGTPDNDDVGTYNITARATDQRGLFMERSFTMSVINVNDVPIWIDVPAYLEIDEGKTFTYDINATDVDIGDEITYSIITFPESNLSIDEDGVITWKTSRGPFEELPYNLTVKVEATDGEETITHTFNLNITPNISPVTTLNFPVNGEILSENFTTLAWTYEDPDFTFLHVYDFYVYFSDTRSDITSLNEDVMIKTDRHPIMVHDLIPGTTYYWTVIPWDGFSNGTCLNETFSFYVNTPPTTDLVKPVETSRLSASEVILSWKSFDIESDNTTYSVYIGEYEEQVGPGPFGTLFSKDIEAKELTIRTLAPGKTYYWTVMANDGHNEGICTSGIWSFTTNSPPEFDEVDDVTLGSGGKVSIDINATDIEDTFTFSLVDYVEGMFINEDTGMFIWIPTETQVGVFNVTVMATDGIDEVLLNFSITVEDRSADDKEKDKDEGISPAIIGLIIASFILLIIIIVIVLLMLRRKKPEENEAEETHPPVEEDTIPPVDQTENLEPVTGPIPVDTPPPAVEPVVEQPQPTITEPIEPQPPVQDEIPQEQPQVPVEEVPPVEIEPEPPVETPPQGEEPQVSEPPLPAPPN